jgi:hypothetical protein
MMKYVIIEYNNLLLSNYYLSIFLHYIVLIFETKNLAK